MTDVVATHTSYSRTQVLAHAPVVSYRGMEFQPTALRYTWSDRHPEPFSLELVVRKLKTDGTPGRATSTIYYGLTDAPQWVAALAVTA